MKTDFGIIYTNLIFLASEYVKTQTSLYNKTSSILKHYTIGHISSFLLQSKKLFTLDTLFLNFLLSPNKSSYNFLKNETVVSLSPESK